MSRLEIVTNRKGLEPFIWKFFPQLVPHTQSESFVIYACRLAGTLEEGQVQILDSLVEEEVIIAYQVSESGQPVIQSHLTPVQAAELSGYSEEYWRKEAWKGKVPGAMKQGKQWLLPRTYVETHKKGEEKK